MAITQQPTWETLPYHILLHLRRNQLAAFLKDFLGRLPAFFHLSMDLSPDVTILCPVASPASKPIHTFPLSCSWHYWIIRLCGIRRGSKLYLFNMYGTCWKSHFFTTHHSTPLYQAFKGTLPREAPESWKEWSQGLAFSSPCYPFVPWIFLANLELILTLGAFWGSLFSLRTFSFPRYWDKELPGTDLPACRSLMPWTSWTNWT